MVSTNCNLAGAGAQTIWPIKEDDYTDTQVAGVENYTDTQNGPTWGVGAAFD